MLVFGCRKYFWLSQNQEAAIIFLLSVAKYSIWLHRNSIVFDEADVCLDDIILDVKKKTRFRFTAEKPQKYKRFLSRDIDPISLLVMVCFSFKAYDFINLDMSINLCLVLYLCVFTRVRVL